MQLERVDRLPIWALFIWDIFPCMFLKLSYTRAEELDYLGSFYDTAMFFFLQYHSNKPLKSTNTK